MYKPLTDVELSDAEERVRLGDPTVTAYLPRLLSEVTESRRRLHALQVQAQRQFSPLVSARSHTSLDPAPSQGSE